MSRKTERSERPTAPDLAQRERLPFPDFGQTAMQELAGSPPAVRRFIHADTACDTSFLLTVQLCESIEEIS